MARVTLAELAPEVASRIDTIYEASIPQLFPVGASPAASPTLANVVGDESAERFVMAFGGLVASCLERLAGVGRDPELVPLIEHAVSSALSKVPFPFPVSK